MILVLPFLCFVVAKRTTIQTEMEKSGGTMTRSFRYDTYHHPPPPPHQYVAHPTHHAHPHHNLHQEATKLQQYGEQTKKTVPEEKLRRRCCRGVATGLCSNLGVCALLLSYTLLGSFIFMAIEGGGETDARRSASRRPNGTHGESPLPSSSVGSSPWLLSVSAGPRERTVESIWDITVSLNILYRENWTRLAAEEVAKFQEFLVQRLAEEWGPPPTQPAPLAARSLEAAIPTPQVYHEWNFARAFLYSLTVLTTIGCGSVSPRTALGKVVTMAYAALGIPLLLLYLSCMGGLLSRGARVIFTARHRNRSESTSKAEPVHVRCCCCAPSEEDKKTEANTVANPPSGDVTATIRRGRGYPASSGAAEYREKLRSLSPGEEELKAMAMEDGAASSTTQTTACCSSTGTPTSTSSPAPSPPPPCLAAPLVLCLCAVVLYVAAGAAVLSRWERWPFLDAAYFCFMSLSTIGFGEMMPGANALHTPAGVRMGAGNATVWFVSLYILAGMAITATCFNILHDEIMQRLKNKYRSTTTLEPPAANGAAVASTTTASSRAEPDEDPYS